MGTLSDLSSWRSPTQSSRCSSPAVSEFSTASDISDLPSEHAPSFIVSDDSSDNWSTIPTHGSEKVTRSLISSSNSEGESNFVCNSTTQVRTSFHAPTQLAFTEPSITSRLYVLPHRRAHLPITADNSLTDAPRQRAVAGEAISPSYQASFENCYPSRQGIDHAQSLPAHVQEGLDDAFDTLNILDVSTVLNPQMKDVGLAGCFKWTEGSMPTMTVPGLPDVWKGNERTIGRLPEDLSLEGNVEWPDYNGASVPPGVSPHEPLFLSLLHPSILQGVNLITGRNNLKKLLSTCFRETRRHIDWPSSCKENPLWRIDAAVVPGTDLVLLDRWDPIAQREPHAPQTWHLSYHEAVTAKLQHGSDRTPGAQRSIMYTFGGIKMIVKCDVDAACIWDGIWSSRPSSENGSSTEESSTSGEDFDNSKSDITMVTAVSDISMESVDPDGVQDGSEVISSASRSSGGSSITLLGDDKVCVTSLGMHVRNDTTPHPPHENLVSIKTRWNRPYETNMQMNNLDAIFANVYWGQIPNLIIGWHSYGDFGRRPPTYLKLGEGLLGKVEELHHEAISRVNGILQWMVETTVKKGRVGFVCKDTQITAFDVNSPRLQFSREAMEIVEKAGISHFSVASQ